MIPPENPQSPAIPRHGKTAELLATKPSMSAPTWSPRPKPDPSVTAWRFRVLRRLGLPDALAQQAAESRDIETAKVAQLVGRGCPPETALRILAPLDWTSRFAAERVR